MTYRIIKNKNKSIFYAILHELRCLVYFYLGEPPKTVIKDQKQKDLHEKLILLAKKDRKLFARFLMQLNVCLRFIHSAIFQKIY